MEFVKNAIFAYRHILHRVFNYFFMIEDALIGQNDYIALTKTTKTYEKGQSALMVYCQYQNKINSQDFETKIQGVNELFEFWNNNAPLTYIPGGKVLGELFEIAFHFENEEIRKKALHSLAFLSLAKHDEYPIQQMKEPEIYESIFSLLSSTNLMEINDGILLLSGICVDEEVNNNLLERGIFDILLKMNNTTFSPILMFQLFSLIFPKQDLKEINEETAAKIEHFKPILDQIPKFIDTFLDSKTPIVVQKTFELLNLVKKLGIKVKPKIVIKRINTLLSSPLNDVVKNSLKFLKRVPEMDQELFDLLIDVAQKRHDIAGKVFKYVSGKIESLGEENYEKFYNVLLQCVEEKSVQFGEKAIPYIVELTTAENASNFRALDCCLQYLDSPNKEISKVSLQGIVKIIQLAEEGAFNDELNEHLAEFEDQLEALTESEDPELSELGIQILDRIKE